MPYKYPAGAFFDHNFHSPEKKGITMKRGTVFVNIYFFISDIFCAFVFIFSLEKTSVTNGPILHHFYPNSNVIVGN